MDFSITKDEESLAKAFDTFCQERIAPRAAQADREGVLDAATWRELAEVGFLGLGIPEEWGGHEAPWVVRCMAQESLAKACASTFLSAGASVGLCGLPLLTFGSDEQRSRWLPRLVRGEAIGCFALTEPGAGTDAASITTRATRVPGGGYLLQGEKALITNAPIADVAVVLAVTDPAAGVGGVSAFVVDLAQKGVTRTKAYQKMGLRASATGGLVFDEVHLDEGDLLGTEGGGFAQAMMILEHGRL
ncbi:MAG: acyl-CoA dehydrogenase family protein, partial [Myxococcota bacterium]